MSKYISAIALAALSTLSTISLPTAVDAAMLRTPNANASTRLVEASASECPNIEGAYNRDNDNLIINWEQDGCKISSDVPSGGYDHKVQGKWNGKEFIVRTVRRNIQNGCTTTMYGRLSVANSSQLLTSVYGSDGRCDLPKNYKEDSTWNRL